MFTPEELLNEKWKECGVPGYSDYQISTLGRVKSFKRNKKDGKIMSSINTSANDIHQKVNLSNGGTSKKFFIHRLVLLTFNPIDGSENLQVNHIDGNPLNNRLENLEWVTSSENHTHYKEVLIPEMRKNGIFEVGRKPSIIEVTFSNGEKNYYMGIEKASLAIGVSKNTINRWLKNFDKESIIDKRIINVKTVESIPEGHQNIDFKVKSQVKEICIEYWKKPAEYYNNCKEADKILGLKIGTIQRWVHRNWDRVSSGKVTQMGIKKIYYTTNE